MKINSIRRWCRPKAILVISTLTESPAHIFQVVSAMRTTGARLFLVQLPPMALNRYPSGRDLPFLLPAAPRSFELQSASGPSPTLLWAEILSEVTVLRNTPVERIPSLVESLAADLVVLTAPEIGRIPFGGGEKGPVDLFGSLGTPILICGPRANMRSWNARELHKILVPVTLGPDLGWRMRFACRFARRHHGRITVLHVFDNSDPGPHAWERTPVAVEAKLPLSELKQEGILCPMEIAVSAGYPERKILAFNQQRPHDLIVMGGPRPRHSSYGLGQSISEAVLAEAPCPVLILGSAMRAIDSVLAESRPHLILA